MWSGDSCGVATAGLIALVLLLSFYGPCPRFCKGAGIDGVEADPAASGDNRIYSVSGAVVRENADPAAPFAGLTPGIYIMNGRKYVVK